MPRRAKRDLHVLISEELYEALVKVAPRLSGAGVYRGALSEVVEEAIKFYLVYRLGLQGEGGGGAEGGQRTHTNSGTSVQHAESAQEAQSAQGNTKPNRVHKVFQDVVEALKENLGLDDRPKEVLVEDLEKALKQVRGADPRTVSKWIKILEEQGLIRRRHPRIVEILHP